MIAKTEGFVLKSFDFRETSRIATFFTRDYGKVKGVLKGIRKTPSKFGSSVDRFSLNDIVYYQYRNSDIHLISHCDMKDYYTPIRGDLRRMTAASYAAELIDAVLPVEEENIEIYALFQDFLVSLGKTDDVSKLVHMFQIKILLLSGFKPHLETCVKCERIVEGATRFSQKLGGLVCGTCKDPGGDWVPISRGAVASILHVQKEAWARAIQLGVTPVVKKELKFILNHFLVFHLEKHLRATRFLT